jgi:two-component system response regulator AtoC
LDEIGEMNLSFQAKLLRAIQEKEITRVGGNQVVKVNCRIIVATNRNLLDEVKAGNFREDLYYRLFGLPILLPPLRERDKDILLLSKFFIANFSKENGMDEKSLSESAKRKLLSYPFPGNVRELKALVELGVVLSNGQIIEDDDITVGSGDVLPSVLGEETTMREYNRRIINIYMDKYNRDTKLIADKLGIGQTTVYRLLKEEEGEKT